MRSLTVSVLACSVAVLLGCGEREDPVPLPASGSAYRSLPAAARLAVARSCRDRAAARAGGAAARQLRDVEPKELRSALDDAFSYYADRRRSVPEMCAERLPFVTRGLSVSFSGAKRFGGDGFTYETTSDKRLTMHGTVSPAPLAGHVTVQREGERPTIYAAEIRAGGHFIIPRLRLRKQADNTFVLTIDAPPNARRKVYFSALCLDCLAGAPAPSARQ
jgi:hypothetical protein